MADEQKPLKKKSLGRFLRRVAHALWHDHEFGLNAIAAKGGAGAALMTGLYGVSIVLSWPLAAAAGGIALCGGLIALGLYGAALGTEGVTRKLRALWRHEETPARQDGEKAARARMEKLLSYPLPQRIANNRIAQALLASRAWRVTRRFMKKQEDRILGATAVGGSLVYLAAGVVLLATQVTVLPVAALSVVTVTAATYIAGALSGLYFSAAGMIDARRRRGEKAAAPSAPVLPPVPESRRPAAPASPREAFGQRTPPPAAAPPRSFHPPGLSR